MDVSLIVLGSGFALLVAVQAIIARAVARQQRAVDQVSDRLSHMVAALSLLTDSTESGLRDVITELERVGAPDAARPRRAAGTTRRISAAAKRGRSVQEIASAERVSEGEVKLRLQLGSARSGKHVNGAAAAERQG